MKAEIDFVICMYTEVMIAIVYNPSQTFPFNHEIQEPPS